MSGQCHRVRNGHELECCFAYIRSQYEQHGNLEVSTRAAGKSRSIDQNSLFQAWSREYASHLTDIPVKKIPAEVHENMKYTLQRRCYAATGWDWLLETRVDLMTGEEKIDRKSTTRLEPGQMYQFMEWVQAMASNDGLILEAKGQYQTLQQKEAA